MISVAMTTFNGEKYIAAQIESVLKQTLSDFELIICDDGSSDETVRILKAYAEKDSRIKLFENEQNLGFKKNFEKAISLCKGDFVAFCDQDDIWFPEHLAVLKENIGESDLISADSVLFYGNETPVRSKNEIHLSDTNGFYRVPKNQKELLYRFLANTMCTPGHNMLVRKGFLLQYIPIPDSVKYHDAWFATVAVLKGKYTYINQCLTFYRQHSAQITKHLEYSYIGALKNIFKMILKKKKYKTDRIGFIHELRKLGIDKETECLFLEIENFQKWRMHQTSKKDSQRACAFFTQNYRLINTRENTKYRFVRLIELCAMRFAAR